MRPRRSLARLLLAVFATMSLALAVHAPLGRADQMTVLSCHDSAGNPVGHDGWSNARTSEKDMTAADSCAAADAGGLTLELGASSTGYPDAAHTEWVFTAPSWASISSYSLEVAESYAVPSTGTGSGQAYIEASDESDPLYDFRNLGAGELGAFKVSRTPPAPDSSLAISASCDGEAGPCPAGAIVSRIDVRAAEITLNDSTTPSVRNLAGSLLAAGPVSGVAEASFEAFDSGPGVYSGQLIVDGSAQPAVVLDANGGWCVNRPQSPSGLRSFAHPDPCAPSVSASLQLDTSALKDGAHSLKLLVDDASGNTTTAFNGTITTKNLPTSPSAPSILAPTGSLATLAGSQGIANGTRASEGARISLDGRHAISRSYGQRAFRLSGRLLDAQGQPISGASIDVLSQTAGTNGRTVILKAQTASDGTFAAHVPAGPSRVITLAYRAFSADPGYATEASVTESVSAGVALRITPHRSSPMGAITISGTVSGPIPRRGVVVTLLVYYRGVWEPFRDPHTDTSGHFHVRYHFQGAVGRFPFRAEVLGEQAGLPYATGKSASVGVRTD